jgi:FkbM family methyltransferase
MDKTYYSQYGQDKFLNEKIFKNQRDGFFFDIGANDGITFSNTYYFEKNLNWSGICVEPIQTTFEKLTKNRTSDNINGCISDFEGTDTFYEISGYSEMLSGLKSKYHESHLERIRNEVKEFGGDIKEIEVTCYNINNILLAKGIEKVDYLSIDIEGGEKDLLKVVDFKNFCFDYITIENNYDDNEIRQIMESKKFKKIAVLGCDELYQKKKSSFYTFFNSFSKK